MIITSRCVGIHVSKHHLDIFDEGIGVSERIANAPHAITELVARWRCDALVVFEATGVYDLELRAALRAADIRFARINPARARDFARASGQLAKTDPIDARMLAAFARTMRPATEQILRLPATPWRDWQNGGINWSSCEPRRRTVAVKPGTAPWSNASAASSKSSITRSPRSRLTSARSSKPNRKSPMMHNSCARCPVWAPWPACNSSRRCRNSDTSGRSRRRRLRPGPLQRRQRRLSRQA